MALVLRNTVVGGRRAGLEASAGIFSRNLIHITYCLLGVGVVISRSIVAFSALKYAGAAYLNLLGIVSLRVSAGTLDAGEIDRQRSHRTWITQGFVNNLLNPKGTLF